VFCFHPVAPARRLQAGTDRLAAGAAITLTDDAGHTVPLAPLPSASSLVPSVTETIIALDAGDRIVGRTEYDRDSSLAAVPLIGRGLSPSIEAMIALHPDLVVVWASDKRGDLRGQLEKAKIPVLALGTGHDGCVQGGRALGAALGRGGGRRHAVDS
jgi:iron complex transport system substrate-binding protein